VWKCDALILFKFNKDRVSNVQDPVNIIVRKCSADLQVSVTSVSTTRDSVELAGLGSTESVRFPRL